MIGLLSAVGLPGLVVLVLVFAVLPRVVVQLAVRMISDPDERAAVLADYHDQPWHSRPLFAADMLAMGLTEGLVRGIKALVGRLRQAAGHEPDRLEVRLGYSGSAIVATFVASDAFLPASISWWVSIILAAMMMVNLILLKVQRPPRRDDRTK